MPVTERITTVSVSITPLRNLTPDNSEPVVRNHNSVGGSRLLLRMLALRLDERRIVGILWNLE